MFKLLNKYGGLAARDTEDDPPTDYIINVESLEWKTKVKGDTWTPGYCAVLVRVVPLKQGDEGYDSDDADANKLESFHINEALHKMIRDAPAQAADVQLIEKAAE